jgi:hypothetical protein
VKKNYTVCVLGKLCAWGYGFLCPIDVVAACSEKVDHMTLKINAEASNVNLRLLVPPREVEKLEAMGRSREGISCSQDKGPAISLQVDYLKDSRRQEAA